MTGLTKTESIRRFTDFPTTGVFSIHGIEWIHEENGINLDFQEYCRQCSQDDRDCDCDYEDQGDTYLIGFIYDHSTGQYDIDPAAEYSAIVNYDSQAVQVVRSHWTIRGAWCSPCYPNQVDGDTPGDILGYAPPPDVIGFEDSEESIDLRKRIF